MIRAAVLLLAVAACNGMPDALADPPAQVTAASRLPHREELVCFACHSHVKFERGPRFAHGLTGHRKAGHCHVCHQGQGHHGQRIDASACLSCHDEGSKALESLATDDRSSR